MSIDVEDFDTIILADMMTSNVRPHIFVIEFKELCKFDEQYELVKNEYELIEKIFDIDKTTSGDSIYKIKEKQ